jgi:hypothetical protein
MNYQVMFKDDEGRNIASPIMGEHAKNVYVETLEKNNIKYDVVGRDQKKWHCARVVFDLQLIDAAKKAIKENKEANGVYTFGDPDCLAEEDEVVKVECTDGRVKNAYVVGIWLATADEIKNFKAHIGYKKLGIVIKKIKGGK